MADNAPKVLLDDAGLFRLVQWSKVFGDETRLRLMVLLLDGERCVQDLAAALSITSSATSHQLRELRLAGMVQSRRSGKQIYYTCKNEWVRQQLILFFSIGA